MALVPPQHVDQNTLENLKAKLVKLDFSPQELVNSVKELMVEVEQSPVKGELQKQLVVFLIKLGIQESQLEPEPKALAMQIASSGAVEATIELAVAVSKGRVAINQSTLRQCLPCLPASWFT